MERYILDTSAISQMLELCKSGRARKIARLWYVNQMSIEDIEIQTGCPKSVIVSEVMLINMLIGNNIPSRTCSQCGEKFYTTQNVRKCPNCKEQNRIERETQQKEVYKAVKPNNKPKKRKLFKSIPQIEKERVKYNKEHGTLLSYGQYVLLMGE